VTHHRSSDRALAGDFAINTVPLIERDILNQEAFHKVISLERRRTERSRKPIMLMLLDMGDPLPSAAAEKDLHKLLAILSTSTRETDVSGWYKRGHIVGVLFTEFSLESRGTIVSTMTARLSEMLQRHASFEQFNQVSISFHMFPEDWNEESRTHSTDPVFYPDLSKRHEARRFSGALKRAIDILVSATGLVFAAPVFLAIAAAIKAGSKGPIFYRQARIGQNGAPFMLLKFRSMYMNNDPSVHREYVKRLIAGTAERQPSNGNGGGVFKLTSDPRITRVGAFLRKSSLDELPQLINVLRGEMSLVGPRPPLTYEVENYDLWHRRRLNEAKPGITGLWQVSGRNRVTFDEMVRLDLRYARSWSPWMDIKILLRTPMAVFDGQGAH
jgi:lipopolysaccharide/colanic/teichoic acid biosynthesis glycosyltransferase